MRLLRFIIKLTLLNCSQGRLSKRHGFNIKQKFKEKQPFLYASQGLPSKVQYALQFQEQENEPFALQMILLLELPLIEKVDVFHEALEVAYSDISKDKENSKDLLLLTGNLINEQLIYSTAVMDMSKYKFNEFSDLLDKASHEIALGSLFFNLKLRDFLSEHPELEYEGQEALKQYSIALDRGVSFGMLNELIKGIALRYKRLTYLPFWATPAGHSLFVIERKEPIKIFPGAYLVEVLEDHPNLIDWVRMAYYEMKSMAMVTVMFLLPEKAEQIYRSHTFSDNFKWVFTENISDWRREYAAMMNWDEIKWSDMTFYYAVSAVKNCDQKENDQFDGLIKNLNTIGVFSRVFNQNHTYRFIEQYQEKSFDYDEPEFFYMKLKRKGYPIDKIPNSVDDELEVKILMHHKKEDTDLNWIYLKLVEIMGIYSYSKHIAFRPLCAEVDRRLNEPNNDLFKFWASELAKAVSELTGGNIDFEIPETNKLGRFVLGKLFGSVAFKDDLAIFYPKLLSKLKRETDAKSRTFLVEMILSRLIFQCFGEGLPSWFFDTVHSLLVRGLEDDRHIFDNWTEDFANLLDDFNSIYKIYDPLSVLSKGFGFYTWGLGHPRYGPDILENYFKNYNFTDDLFDDIKSIVDYSDQLSPKDAL